VRKGHFVAVYSACDTNTGRGEVMDGFEVTCGPTSEIFRKGTPAAHSDCVIWVASPLTPMYYGRLAKMGLPIILLFTGSFYSLTQVVKAHASGVPFSQLATHYKNALVPLGLTSLLARASFVKATVCLSQRNATILRGKGCPGSKIQVISPGYDRLSNDAFGSITVDQMRGKLFLPKTKKILTYLGSPYEIRGINMLLNAFKHVHANRQDILLLLLARTVNGMEAELLSKRVASLGIAGATRINLGLLDERQIWGYLFSSDAVVLPFVLVPSDMPLSVFEAMALGKPVITSNIDGMAEVVRDSGILVRGEKELAKAIGGIFEETGDYEVRRQRCFAYSRSFPSWREVTDRFEDLLNEIS